MSTSVPLGELTSLISSGSTPLGGAANYSESGEVMLVRSQNVQMRALALDDVAFVSRGLADRMARTYLRRGDALLNITGASIGRTALFDLDIVANVNQHVCVIRPDADRLDGRYLVAFLASPSMQRRIMSEQNGGTRQALTFSQISGFRVPLPPLPEQRRIADILDKADAIRCKRKEAIALTEDLLRSAFLEMFGDPVTNPKAWPTETIDDLCSRGAGLVDGPFGSSLKPEHYVASGVKVVRNRNIYDDHFDFNEFKYVTPTKFEEIRRSEVLPGDVLITTKGTVGDVCVAPDLGGPAVLSASGTVRLRVPPDGSYLPEFVVGQMTTRRYKSYLHTFEAGSAQQYLNLSAIRKMRLIRPPEKEQVGFRSFRARLRKSQRHVRDAHDRTEDLFDSLVARAFSGSLEVAC